jgi:RNA polymerase sigma-70 factor (ECF subfamily)
MTLFKRSNIGSPAAFTRLYQSNRLPVFRYIYGLTGGPQAEVEDLTAETFLRAWKARRRFDGDDNQATGWLIRIAKRLVIDGYRRNKTTTIHTREIQQETDPLPEEIILQHEQTQILMDFLDKLTGEQREILVLRYMLGWKVLEIAGYLDMSENNVSVTIHRCLEHLRLAYEEADQPYSPALMIAEEKTQ